MFKSAGWTPASLGSALQMDILAFPQPVEVEISGQKEEALFLSVGKWDLLPGTSFLGPNFITSTWVGCWASLVAQPAFWETWV